ncbi:hypothetical protein [Saccharicrinis aurantiacus]|uniref:hypothetical protein n=1 Tax=Saccharicrinis aurantiacus TaxID=1849719 RepID=UPI00249099B4|nr:hypothetical protein [Saccharicrinis aurantiacus]
MLFKKVLMACMAALLLCSFNSAEKAQTLINKVNRYNKSSYPEKLFIHTDKPVYFAGDDVWFQSYLVNAITHLPEIHERVLYVELINPNGVTASKRMFILNQGKCYGHMELDQDMATGKYLMVAYTNWMRNQGSDFFFKKEVHIYAEDVDEEMAVANSERTSTATEPATEETVINANNTSTAKLNLQFYPEGGNLVNGITTRVAFSGVNQAGDAMDFKGAVVDQDGNFCSPIQPIYDGKGFIFIKAELNKQYFAQIEGNNNESITFPLPKVMPQGYSLSVSNRWNNENLDIHIQSNTGKGEENINLLVQQEGDIIEMLEGTITNGSLRFLIPKELVNTGIVQLTLLNSDMIPEAERLAFINHYDALNISIEGAKDHYNSREAIDIQLSVSDKNGNPVEGEFSMSVTDAALVDDKAYSQINLVNHMLLSANLPGKINNIGSLLKNNAEAFNNLDIIMLVNGWRRFKWEKVIADTITTPKYQYETGIYIDGKLKRKSGKKAAPKGIEVTMMLSGDQTQVMKTTTDSKGHFKFNVQDFNDTVDVLVQTVNRSNSKADFNIDLNSNLRFDPADNNARARMMLSEKVATTFFSSEAIKADEVQASKGNTKERLQRDDDAFIFQDTTDIFLDNINVTASKKRTVQENMVEQFGAPSYVVGQSQLEDLMKDTPWYYGLTSLLYDAFPGLRVYEVSNPEDMGGIQDDFAAEEDSIFSDDDGFTELRNQRTVDFVLTGKSPHRFYIYVDGSLIGMTNSNGRLATMDSNYSFDDFMSMDPTAIKSIELVFSPRNSPMFDIMPETTADIDISGAPEAILSIYTKEGTGVYAQSYNKGMANFRLYGFEKVREFYAPQYDGTDDLKVVNDERSTLYWSPSIKTDSLGIGSIQFYNSDAAEQLRFDVAGFSVDGTPGAQIVLKGSITNSYRKATTNDMASDYEQETVENLALSKEYKLGAAIAKSPANNSLAYADITIKGKPFATTTNCDGDFIINLDEVSGSDIVIISSLNFGSAELSVDDLLRDKSVQLQNNLDTSEKIDAEKIIQQMGRKKRSNSILSSIFIKGAYRETIKKNGDLFRVSDFGLIQKKENYYGPIITHETMPLEGREYRTEDYPMQIKYEPLNTTDDLMPIIDPLHQDLSFLKYDNRKDYTYAAEGVVEFQGRKCYKISFTQNPEVRKALFDGSMLIDKETFGLVSLNWKYSETASKYLLPIQFLMPGKTIEKFEVLEQDNTASYYIKDGKWYLKNVSQSAELRIDNIKLAYKREFSTTEVFDKKPDEFKKTSVDKMDKRRMMIRTVNYNPEYWRQPWVLPADKDINEQINFLHEVTFIKQKQ